MSTDDKLGAVREIVVQELDLEPSELTEDKHFIDDYESDSLTLIQVVGRIEREVGVAIPESEYSEVTNLGKLNGLVRKHDEGE